LEPVSTGLDGIDQLIPPWRYAAEGRKQGRQATLEGRPRVSAALVDVARNRLKIGLPKPELRAPMDILSPAMLPADVRHSDGPLSAGRTADGRRTSRFLVSTGTYLCLAWDQHEMAGVHYKWSQACGGARQPLSAIGLLGSDSRARPSAAPRT
jgi:hypothetical protein